MTSTQRRGNARFGLGLLTPLCSELGDAATLHVVEGGGHSFHVLKRLGRTEEEALDELADVVADWTGALL